MFLFLSKIEGVKLLDKPSGFNSDKKEVSAGCRFSFFKCVNGKMFLLAILAKQG